MNTFPASLRIAGLYILLFLIMGAMLPFYPQWLSAQGLSPAQVGGLLSGALLLRVSFSPFLGFWIDKGARHRQSLLGIGLLMLALIGGLALGSMLPLLALMLLGLGLNALLQTLFPIIEGIGAHGAVSHGYDYGRVRLWGSVSFVVGTLCVGHWIEVDGVEVLLWWVAVSLLALLLFLACQPSELFPSHRSDAPRASLADIKALLKDRNFTILCVAAGLVVASHATYYTLSTVIWSQQGYSESQIADFWVIGVVAEVGLFLLAGSLVKRIGVKYMLLIGAVGAVLRWGIMATPQDYGLTLGVQMLHALTFGATHIAVMYYFGHRVPERLSVSAQMVHSILGSGVFMSAMTLASGYAYEWQADRVYWLPSALALLGALLLALGFRRAQVVPAQNEL